MKMKYVMDDDYGAGPEGGARLKSDAWGAWILGVQKDTKLD